MKKSTTRIKAPAIGNRSGFELTVDTIAAATTRLRTLEAERDAVVQIAQNTNATDIAELKQEIDLAAAMCEKYAEAHRPELLPGKAKSAETPLARYGFRTGMPALKTLAKWTWDKVKDRLHEIGASDCIRTKEEIDKETLLKLVDEGRNLAVLNSRNKVEIHEISTLGFKVVQAETFFIEPKVDGAEQVKTGN